MAHIPATPDNDDERFMTDAYTEDSIIPRDTPLPGVPPIIPNDAQSQHTDVTGAPQASPIIPTDAETRGPVATDDDGAEVVIIEEGLLDNGAPLTPTPSIHQMPGSAAMHVGMPVVDVNGLPVGQVKAVSEQGILVNRPTQRDFTVPMNALNTTNERIVLSISAAEAESLGWDQPSAL